MRRNAPCVLSLTVAERDALHYLLYDLDMNVQGWPEGMDVPKDVRSVRHHLTQVLGKVGQRLDASPDATGRRGRPRKDG